MRPGAVAAGCGLVVATLSLATGPVLIVLALASLLLVPVLGIGFALFPMVMTLVRAVANVHRRLARHSGVEIPVPYRPLPAGAGFGTWRRFRCTVGDPATWRDLAWLLPGTVAGAVLGLAASGPSGYGLEGLLGVPVLLYLSGHWHGYGAIWPTESLGQALLSIPQGLLILIPALVIARWFMWLHASFTRPFLRPTKAAELALRVTHLATTRSDTLDAQAAELRRIERDLHDGAQARIVALGMNIGLAEELLRRDPAAAQRLLADARQTSGEALTELRALVRGIHPPVLVERGLAGAVEALALTITVPVEVDLDLPGRLLPPIESTAYFAVAETLANITRHSGARRVWIILRHTPGRLTIMVGDNGCGGADPAAGTGLRGIERRLAAFDGTMGVTSPPGGPTVVMMELPCELSSPKTSPSSETA
ncbi:MAG: sensor histidine kinase [Dactylosporangium sp.]|nr:sensor domain-containing protein [Dactylosporangium sp.]NNJ61616.1 sensor histidine kinase [Dactylosporangium sp.]